MLMSSNDFSNKPHPPSPQRIASAAAIGLFPRSALLLWGTSLLGVAWMVILFKKDFFSSLNTMFQSAADTQLIGHVLRDTLNLLLMSAVTLLAALVPYILLSIFWARKSKKRGQTAIALPQKIPTTIDTLIATGLTLALAIPCSILMIQNFGFTYEEGILAPHLAADRYVSLFGWLLVVIGACCIIGGIIQLSLYKIRLFKHLSLSTSEQEKEQRLHGHIPTKTVIHH